MKKLIFLMMLLPFVLGGCAQKKNYQSMTTPEFQKLLSDDAIQIVDARTPEEYRDGHIEKAVNMDIKDVNINDWIEHNYPVVKSEK